MKTNEPKNSRDNETKHISCSKWDHYIPFPLVFLDICRLMQGRIQKIQKEGAEETDDAVIHHSGSICDQTLGLTLRTFQKYREKGGAAAPVPPPPKSARVMPFSSFPLRFIDVLNLTPN